MATNEMVNEMITAVLNNKENCEDAGDGMYNVWTNNKEIINYFNNRFFRWFQDFLIQVCTNDDVHAVYVTAYYPTGDEVYENESLEFSQLSKEHQQIIYRLLIHLVTGKCPKPSEDEVEEKL